ncbi:MAG: VWA domain-containing protein [Burkholderiaceae bacterium]
MSLRRGNRIAENITHFVRVLRRAGLPLGPDRTLLALQVLEAVGFERREDVHAALSSVMVRSRDQQPVFDAAFAAFWADPKLLEKVLQLGLAPSPALETPNAERPSRRLQEAFRPDVPDLAGPGHDAPSQSPGAPQPDARDTYSAREKLRHADFESMSTDEFLAATRMVRAIDLPLRPIVVRRRRPAQGGRIDLRRTLLRAVRMPDTLTPAHARAQRKRPPLVMMVDISGSMERYARVFLHFAHALTKRCKSTRTFVFGTRLTNLTAVMRERDPDDAMSAAAGAIEDWSGGTRIASTLHEFNRLWARRVLGRNAALILVTDGLDRDENGDLGARPPCCHDSRTSSSG